MSVSKTRRDREKLNGGVNPEPPQRIRVHGIVVNISFSSHGVSASSADDRFCLSEYMNDERRRVLRDRKDREGWRAEMDRLERNLIARLRRAGR